MKVLVPVKQVARLAPEAVLLAGAWPEPDALERQLNDWDGFSMEAAVGLVEQDGQGEVTAVSVGDRASEDGLRACLAKGAQRAVRVWGECLEQLPADVDPGDPLIVAAVLAALAHREAPDLILCGAQSSDAAHAATGIALAGLLDLPHVAVVRSVTRDARGVLAEREIEGGAIELLRVELPALMTVQTGPKAPRHPNFRALREARSKPLEVIDTEDLGVAGASLADRAGYRLAGLVPRQASGGELLVGSAAAVAQRIAEIVEQELDA